MLRDQLKSQGTICLPEEDLQDVRKEDGATQSLVKICGTAYNKKTKKRKYKQLKTLFFFRTDYITSRCTIPIVKFYIFAVVFKNDILAMCFAGLNILDFMALPILGLKTLFKENTPIIIHSSYMLSSSQYSIFIQPDYIQNQRSAPASLE